MNMRKPVERSIPRLQNSPVANNERLILRFSSEFARMVKKAASLSYPKQKALFKFLAENGFSMGTIRPVKGIAELYGKTYGAAPGKGSSEAFAASSREWLKAGQNERQMKLFLRLKRQASKKGLLK